MPNYPILILPDDLARISSATPPIPNFPTEPTKPILAEPNQPTVPREPTTFSQAWGCGLLTIGTFMLIIYGARNSDFVDDFISELPFPFSLIFIASPFLAVYFIYSYHKNSDYEKEEYASKLRQYESDLAKYERDKLNYVSQYEKDLNDYNSIVYPNYLNAVKQHESEKERLLSKPSIQDYRQKLIRDFFKNTREPEKVDNPYITGVSEEPFFQFLKSKSSDFIKGYSIVDDISTNRYYVPDIVYFNRHTGVLIDIEIDEPYLGSDGTPIHYVGYDDRRNNFFTSNGWIVIRFAEEQVVKHPEQCYSFIEHFTNRIKVAQFDPDYDCITTISHWTKDDAHKMAFVRTRNKYLDRNLIEKIPEEILIVNKNDDDQKIEKLYDDLPF
jgi:hypothetical protein